MSYAIVRLVVLDWNATVQALRARGVDFYFAEVRDETSDNTKGEHNRSPIVEDFEGPLSNCPGFRDPEANWIYHLIRDHLDDESRAFCDTCFSKLFWRESVGMHVDEADGLVRDLAGAGCPLEGIWYALNPETTIRALEQLRALPWQALETAAAKASWESEYLPTFADFEHHVSNHKDLLRYAVKRRAGVLGVVSA